MRFISIFLANIILKLDSTILFIRLKIILLQYFKFLTISDIPTDIIYVYLNVFIIVIINKQINKKVLHVLLVLGNL